MKKINSQALGILQKALGLSGRGSQDTELTDGVVDQFIAINELARRGNTLSPSAGIFTAILSNEHTDAETITTAIDPYNVGTTAAIPPYPPNMPDLFDIWLLSVGVRRQSGTGTLTAVLHWQYGSDQQGFGIDDSGVNVTQSAPVALAYWTGVGALNTTFGILAAGGGTGQPTAFLGMRLPRSRNGSLEFTSTSSLTSTYNAQLTLGVFPVSLGQDGLV